MSLFRANGFAYEGEPAKRQTEPLTLFRGATETTKRGMSWTTDLNVARRFAYDQISGRPVGHVYTTSVAPQWLLAYINEGHSECEWVVDSSGLRADDVSTRSVPWSRSGPRRPRRSRGRCARHTRWHCLTCPLKSLRPTVRLQDQTARSSTGQQMCGLATRTEP